MNCFGQIIHTGTRYAHAAPAYRAKVNISAVSRCRWPVEGWSGLLQRHTKKVAVGVHGFTVAINLRGFKIDRLVANRAIET
jgi:hypothetical protein